MAKVPQKVKEEIAEDFNKATTREARKVTLDYWMKHLNASRDKVYRLAKKGGWSSGRKKRSDAGIPTSGVTMDHLLLIAGAKDRACRKFGTNKRYIMPTETAMEVIEERFGIKFNCSASTVNRLLAENNLAARQMKEEIPFMPQKTLFANHVHEIDASVAITYRLDPHGRFSNLRLIDRETNINKIHQLQQIKTKIIRIIIVDHYSGAFYVFYVISDGEKATDFLEGLWRAWTDKGADFPFCGVPKILYTDKGSSLQSFAAGQIFTALDIELITHQAGNPRAKGAVETLMTLVENQFESRLADDLPATIEEMNARAYRWARELNSYKPHHRHGEKRFVKFTNSINEKTDHYSLRLPPDFETFCELATSAPEERTVNSGRIVKWRKKKIFLGDDFAPTGVKVTVVRNIYNPNSLYITYKDQTREFDIPEYDEAGFPVDAPVIGTNFKRRKDTNYQKGQKAAERKILEKLEIERPSKKPVKTYKLEKIKEAKTVDVGTTKQQEVILPYFKLCGAIAEALGVEKLNDTERSFIEIHYPSGARREDIKTIINQMAKYKQSSLRSVKND